MNKFFNQFIQDYFIESRVNESPVDWVFDSFDDLPERDRLIESIYAEMDNKFRRINQNIERLQLPLVAILNDDALVVLYAESWTGYSGIHELDDMLQGMDDDVWNVGRIRELCGYVDDHGE